MASIGNDSDFGFDVDDDFGFGRDEEEEELEQQPEEQPIDDDFGFGRDEDKEELEQQPEEQPIDDDFGFGRDEEEEELEQQPEEQTTEEPDIQQPQQQATVPTIQQPEVQEVAIPFSAIKKRHRFTIQEKLMFLRHVNCKMESGMTQHAACLDINIDHKQICDWRKNQAVSKQQPIRRQDVFILACQECCSHTLMVFSLLSSSCVKQALLLQTPLFC